MARPPEYARGDDGLVSLSAVKSMAKRLSPEDRATLLAWLALYYDDNGVLFSSQITKRRERIVLGGLEYWLMRVPTKK
jgi:hypothetical protein